MMMVICAYLFHSDRKNTSIIPYMQIFFKMTQNETTPLRRFGGLIKKVYLCSRNPNSGINGRNQVQRAGDEQEKIVCIAPDSGPDIDSFPHQVPMHRSV